ncbi:MAG TPA: tRNA (N6-isopentenyl adenosine(37)-C2)-methylthiotransferase MiaB [Candidatus Stercoripulliclostridium merdigallinarum]|uniref:tRNA-2-methylthio-N(6)-dimethylallyladenosine synthase n=1 Tax=Candidatus Stercoripulliclostridium merdigallinarum TaxID=2840951 RepID=A0A9D1SHC9_9FIRM|nr:tRNA (N6-isopentenyl adenosine(37)-C2)-methylthiotransferase MiaB [Candidatus Stercoripulliclostridium merdigallinarum]
MNYYYIETFGCQMNVHESEKLAGILENRGLSAVSEASRADVIVFNTCCIRDTAEKKIEGNIGELKALKRSRPDLIIVISGCMTQQKGRAEALKKRFPFIDIILGTNNQYLLGEKIDEVLAKKKKLIAVDPAEKPAIDEDVPVYRTSYPNAWINIMYGCNNFCTYCIVPYVRGRERSRDPEHILTEIRRAVADGYKEITLLGQNVDSYGSDMDSGMNFYKLLQKIAEIDGKFRIRFMTSHPKDLSEEVIKLISEHPNFCNNIHLPVQSGSDAVLKRMNRKYTRGRYLDLIDTIRKYMPDAGITTDIMVGFPGETEQDFKDTIDLVKRVRFQNAFTFVYSPRNGTPAAAMEQIPADIKKARITELVALQNAISDEISLEYLNKTYEVLVEDEENGVCAGRTDSGRLVRFPGERSDIGKFIDVTVTKSKASSLYGEKA